MRNLLRRTAWAASPALCLTVIAAGSVAAQAADDVHPLIRISCGGSAGNGYAADTAYDSGNAYEGTSSIDLSMDTSAPESVCRHERWGQSFRYAIPASAPPTGKSYTVRLHFAELYDNAPGERVMDVSINDAKVLSRFDVFAEAGAKNKAIVREFAGIKPNANGEITIAFAAEAGHNDANAAINGIEILGDGWAPKPAPIKHYPFENASLPIAKRVDDLVSRMTLAEKVGQMANDAPGIPRLNIPAYGWWNEALHGVARAGVATVFPQAIGLAGMWDQNLQFQMASVISDEARAKYNDAIAHGNHSGYYGLDFWSPNINIFRDPRWGRGQETYGEDPYLTGHLGVAFIKGLQGSDRRYFKTIATAKHFAVHSGPERLRHVFDVHPSDYDLGDTYLPAFELAVREGKAYSVMGAYNSVDGFPACASPFLLKQTLRDKWGFGGYVVSDCGAISDINGNHHFAKTNEEASADAVKAGCDLACDGAYSALVNAVYQGLITEAQIDVSVKRLFTARFKLGMFDPPARVPFSTIPISVNDSAAHRELAARTARESVTLLRNEANALPLAKTIRSVAVIGPNAADNGVLLGNYNGDPSRSTNFVEGIRAKLGPDAAVGYEKGCDIKGDSKDGFPAALALAQKSDVVVAVMGLNQAVEGEEGSGGGDRTDLDLPGVQEDLLEALAATGKPVVLVLVNGSALSINWAAAHIPAIVEAWYPGEEGGNAVADVLFGDYNPAGRLPVTFYESAKQLPEFEDYSMRGRTYRYFDGHPLYAFGYGLSYTQFAYSNLKVPARARSGKSITVSASVRNTGQRAGDEVVELYLQPVAKGQAGPMPRLKLGGFQRIPLAPGQSRTVSLTISPEQLKLVDSHGDRTITPEKWNVYIGGRQPEITTDGKPSAGIVTGSIAME